MSIELNANKVLISLCTASHPRGDQTTSDDLSLHESHETAVAPFAFAGSEQSKAARLLNMTEDLFIMGVLPFVSAEDRLSLCLTHRAFQPLVLNAVRLQKKASWTDILLYRLRMRIPLGAFSNLTQITRRPDLSLASVDCLRRTDLKLADITNVAPGLTAVDLTNSDIKDIGLTILSQRCSQLATLSLSHCIKFTHDGIVSVTRPGHLTYLSLSWCYPDVRPESFEAIARNCPELIHLYLCGYRSLRDEHVSLIAARCKKIQFLYFNECPELTDASLVSLKDTSSLRGIGLQGNRNITMGGIQTLAQGRLFFEVDLRQCPWFDRANLEAQNPGVIFYLDNPEPIVAAHQVAAPATVQMEDDCVDRCCTDCYGCCKPVELDGRGGLCCCL